MALSPGTLFERYRVEEVIGQGGMGAVYRAFDTRLCRSVALKVLLAPDEAPASGEARARLLREARTAAGLSHPGVVSVYDVGEHEGTPFLVMELVAGVPLRRYVSADVPLPVRLRWLVDIARALSAAHAAGLVHRDVKPDNVMVRPDGSIKVLDFGIARAGVGMPAEAATAAAPITGAHLIVGTLVYMAPEQIRREPLDGRTDEFAWGVLAYELVSGKPPWNDPDPLAVMAQVLTVEPSPLSALSPGLPAGVAAVIHRALAKAPAARFPTMDDVADALEPFAEPFDPRASSPRSMPRAVLPPTTGEEATQRVATGSEAATRLAPTAPSQRSRKTRGFGPWLVAAGAALVVLAAGAGVHFASSLGPSSAAPTRSATAPPAPVGTTLVDLPSPPSAVPEAVKAYREGMALIREGLFERADKAFADATAKDPSLGAAYLRRAILSLDTRIGKETRDYLRLAEDHAEGLSPREKRILAAIDAGARQQPPDWKGCLARLDALLAESPRDIEVLFLRGYLSSFAGTSEDVVAAYTRATDVDPGFALAWGGAGEGHSYLGQFEESQKAFDRCTAITARSVGCLVHKSRVAVQLGDCDTVAAISHRVEAIDSDSWLGPQMLAVALAGRSPTPAVEAALESKWARMAEPGRTTRRLRDLAQLRALDGRFDEALRFARENEAAVKDDKEQGPHGVAARLLATLLLEVGRDAEAAQVAVGYLDRKDAWEPNPRAEDFALAEDATPFLLATMVRGRRLPLSALDAPRGQWRAAWDAKAGQEASRFLWLHGNATPALVLETKESALAALAELRAPHDLPAFRPFTLTEAAEGITYFQAGRAADAVAPLERAVKACRTLDFPVEQTRAHAYLGAAREALGDTAGACAAYDVVLARWGKAAPRSVTMERVRGRRAVLRCPSP